MAANDKVPYKGVRGGMMLSLIVVSKILNVCRKVEVDSHERVLTE